MFANENRLSEQKLWDVLGESRSCNILVDKFKVFSKT